MKRKFQLFSLTKGEQRVVLLIAVGLLLTAAYRIEQRPKHKTFFRRLVPGQPQHRSTTRTTKNSSYNSEKIGRHEVVPPIVYRATR